jgi:hypothetical protein
LRGLVLKTNRTVTSMISFRSACVDFYRKGENYLMVSNGIISKNSPAEYFAYNVKMS